MPLSVACLYHARLMRHSFQVRWTWILVSESYRLVLWCHLFDWKLPYIYIYIYQLLRRSRMCDRKLIFKRSLLVVNSKFSFSKIGCNAKVWYGNFTYYLQIAGKRFVWFIPFPNAFVALIYSCVKVTNNYIARALSG